MKIILLIYAYAWGELTGGKGHWQWLDSCVSSKPE